MPLSRGLSTAFTISNTSQPTRKEICSQHFKVTLDVRYSLSNTVSENQSFHLENTLLQLNNCGMFLKHLSIYAIKYLTISILIPPQKIIKNKRIETDSKEQNCLSCMVGLTARSSCVAHGWWCCDLDVPSAASVSATDISELSSYFCVPHRSTFFFFPSFLPARRFLLVL